MMSSIHFLTGPFATDALDDAERLAFEDHLTACADCRAEVAGLRETVALLAGSLEAGPSEALRQQMLDQITVVRPLPPGDLPRELPLPTPLVRVRRSTRSPRFRLTAWAAAAATVAAIGTGVVVLSPSDHHAAVSVASQVLHASDRRHSSVESDAGWTASVWHSDTQHRAVIVTTKMPPPPDGMVYQLWLDQPVSGMVPAGLMSGAANETRVLDGDAATANRAGITLEPAGGSLRPTSEPIAEFDFGQGA